MTDELLKAYQAGVHARAAHWPVTKCPVFAPGQLGDPQRQAWIKGWRDGPEKRDGA